MEQIQPHQRRHRDALRRDLYDVIFGLEDDTAISSDNSKTDSNITLEDTKKVPLHLNNTNVRTEIALKSCGILPFL